MENNTKKIVTRFAPSPTGYMHIGGVRTALYAWAYARQNGGTFILRIEDTDKEREVAGSIEHIIETLTWLGINWDEGVDIGGPNAPYKQSERLDSYRKYAQILIDKNLAYADPYTVEEIDTFRQKAILEKRAFLYRDHRPENPPIWDGTMPLRLKIIDPKETYWTDLVRGSMKAGAEALDDFILIKSDGYPTYNFAHIIDDLEMGVTHVMRADEFISSTPKFLALYEALDIERPEFVTLPPIMSLDGKKKLGKRDGAKDILEYRDEGFLPSAMINFLAFIGWSPKDETEIYSPQEFIQNFDIARIHKSGGGYNEDKLAWINKEHIKLLSYEEQEEYIARFLPENIKKMPTFTTEILHQITPIVMERVSCGQDVTDMAESGELDYFFTKPVYEKESLFSKNSKIDTENKYTTLASYLEKVVILLSEVTETDFTKEKVKEIVYPYAKEVGTGDVLYPVRYALSGLDKSPDPFILAEVLGKSETISRIVSAIEILAK